VGERARLHVLETIMTDGDAKKALTEVPTSMAARMLGIDPRTLYAWRDTGKIKGVQGRSGRFLWDVADYLEREEASAR
jgi:helix-turn-helix protein